MAYRIRAVILAGGEGSRLGVLTAKRTKPAVPFAGKYRIIDFTLSNCVNSNIFDILILAQYRPHSLIEHIATGGPWDLNRNFTGGVSIHTPYKGRSSSDWYLGTADAVQQNFLFIKRDYPDFVLILSGDHIYSMDFRPLIEYHVRHQADATIVSLQVPLGEASRFGILAVDSENRITSFVEKPEEPLSNLANMGVYLFNTKILDRALWEDRDRSDSFHDFGKDILPQLVNDGKQIYSFPYSGYWVDVGTDDSYWRAHMDLLKFPSPIDLNDRSWIIHTRTEERPPSRFARGSTIIDSLVSDGCYIAPGAVVERSVLSPGVIVLENARIFESVILTDAVVKQGAQVAKSVLDKRVTISPNSRVGAVDVENPKITIIGKNSVVMPGMMVEPGAIVGPDVVDVDYSSAIVRSEDFIQTSRLPYEI